MRLCREVGELARNTWKKYLRELTDWKSGNRESAIREFQDCLVTLRVCIRENRVKTTRAGYLQSIIANRIHGGAP
jgi:hypothetical protein